MNPRKIGLLTLAYKNFDYMANMEHTFIANAVDKDSDPDYIPTKLGAEIVRMKNKGFAANWNEAVRLFRESNPQATHVVLQNSDIQYNPIELSYAIFRLDPNIHLATWAFNSANRWAHPNYRPVDNNATVPYVEFTAPIVSLELWDKLGGLDESCPNSWGNDIKFGYDAWGLGYKPEVLRDFSFHHFGKKSTPLFNQKLFSDKMVAYLENLYGKDWQRVILSHTPHINKIW